MRLSQVKFKSWQVFSLFLVLGLLLFTSSLWTSFLSDDWHWLYLAKNTNWSWQIFATNYEGLNLGGSYNPLLLIIFKVFYSLFGLHSGAYHFVSILLHALNALIIYLLAQKIFVLAKIKNHYLSIIAGALFLIWPTQVETINWLAAWPHLWMTTFYLSSFLFYLIWRSDKKAKFFILSLVLFLAALFTKELAISLPLVILLWEIYFVSTNKKYKQKTWITSYWLILALFLSMRLSATQLLFGYYGQSDLRWQLLQWFGNLLVFINEFFTWSYLRIFIYKVWYHGIDSLVIVGLSLLALYFFYTYYYKKWWQFIMVNSALLILAPLVPLGLHRTTFGGERYLYLASGFFIIWLIAIFSKVKIKRQLLGILLLIIIPTIAYKNIIWQQASLVSDQIMSSFTKLEIEDKARLISVGLPDNLAGAEVFRNNLQQALELTYPEYSGQIIHLPVYTALNNKNFNDHLLKWREDEMGWFAESVDGSFVVTGQTSIIVNDIYFELWNYNYQNYTANIIRLMPTDELRQQIKDEDIHWLTYDQGKLQIK
ncbi:hypothetical protein HOD19_04635 [bacterium]|nr:hypothetical protein [bacterium]MBT4649030.1 hypothetical protein [bacterium]